MSLPQTTNGMGNDEYQVIIQNGEGEGYAVILKGINSDGTYNYYDPQNDSWLMSQPSSAVIGVVKYDVSDTTGPTTNIPTSSIPPQ